MCAYQSGILIWYWYVRICQIHMMENIKMIWQHKWPKLLRKNTRLMTSFNILFSLSSFLSVRTCYMHCGWTIWVEGFNREYYLTRIMGFCITIMYQLTFRSIYVTISPKKTMHIRETSGNPKTQETTPGNALPVDWGEKNEERTL